jgi:hypothetical protein
MVSPGNQQNFDGDQVSLAISANDSAGGTLGYSATGLPGGLSIDSGTGTISGTIATNADANGPYTVTITASDTNGSASQTVIWDVGYPVGAVNPGDQTSYVDNSQVTLPVQATDAAGGTLTFSATGLPTGLAIDSATGVISGTIASSGGATTTYSTTVTAGDGTYSASTSFQWIVNNPVVFKPTSAQTNNNGDQVSLQISATDANSATLTFSATDLPDGLTISQSTGLISGTIATAPDSNYSTNATITATDGTYTATETVSWTVNDPVSVTNPGPQNNVDGDQVSMQVYASDAHTGTLTYTASQLPPGLTIAAQNGVISGTINNTADTGSPYVSTVTASDGTYSTTEVFAWYVYAQAGAPTVVTYTVDTLRDTHAVNPQNGPQDANGNVSLRSALEAGSVTTANKFIIDFQSGLSGTITLSGQATYQALPFIVRNSSIIGPDNGAITVARNTAPNTPPFRIFTIFATLSQSVSCDISNLTISNGGGTTIDGGGIGATRNTFVSLYHVTLSQNTGHIGGAIQTDGRFVIADCNIRSNSAAADGGGIASTGQALIYNSQISGNSAGRYGGAIFNSTFSSSSPVGSLSLFSTLVVSNWAARGGGIWNSAALTMNSGQLSGNQATADNGGGLSARVRPRCPTCLL